MAESGRQQDQLKGARSGRFQTPVKWNWDDAAEGKVGWNVHLPASVSHVSHGAALPFWSSTLSPSYGSPHRGSPVSARLGVPSVLGECARHQQGPSQLRPPAVAASKIPFKPHFGLKPQSLFSGRKHWAFPFHFFFFNGLFKEQSYKIKISSSGKRI